MEKPIVLVPPRDGSSLSVDVIFEACAEMAERWPEATFVLDPLAAGEHFAQRLDVELDNCRVATYSQANTPMQKASMRLSEAVTGGRLRHAGDETLTAHVLACGVRQIGEGWRLARQKGSSAPIDAAVALAMALSAGVDEDGGAEPPKVPPGGYITRGW